MNKQTQTSNKKGRSTQSSRGKAAGRAISDRGIVYIKAHYNNTIVMIANPKGQKITQESGGSAGFKNARKSTSEAAEVAGKKVGERVRSRGMSVVDVKLNGVGPGREGAVRGLAASGLQIATLQDVTGIAHNGVKKKKRQRK